MMLYLRALALVPVVLEAVVAVVVSTLRWRGQSLPMCLPLQKRQMCRRTQGRSVVPTHLPLFQDVQTSRRRGSSSTRDRLDDVDAADREGCLVGTPRKCELLSSLS